MVGAKQLALARKGHRSTVKYEFILAAAPWLLTLGCSFEPPPVVPVGAAVPVHFNAPGTSSSQQLQISGAGRTEQQCELPCTMQVPSGSAVVAVSGPRKAFMAAVIPAEPSQAEVRFQRRGQAVAGWLMALGGIAAGSVAIAVTRNAGPDGQRDGGIAGLVGGGVGLVGLVVALTAGHDEVRFSSAPVEKRPAALAAGASR
jgi:hypothetical protein